MDTIAIIALALALHLPLPRRADVAGYAAAIASTDATPDEARLLLALAWVETRWQRRGSDGTPPMGLSDFALHHPDETFPLPRAASLALRFVRRHIRFCRGLGPGLGRYGNGRCTVDAYARWVLSLARRMDGVAREMAARGAIRLPGPLVVAGGSP